MEKFNFTDSFIRKNVGKPMSLNFLTGKGLFAEINFQLERLSKANYEIQTPYNEECLLELLLSEGYKVIGSNKHFTVMVDSVKFCFNVGSCQIEGLLPNWYPTFKLSNYKLMCVKRFITEFSVIRQVVNQDIYILQSKFEAYRAEVLRQERLAKLHEMATKAILDGFFLNRGYKYSITYNIDTFSVSANMAHGRKLKFSLSYKDFSTDSTKIIDYMTRLADLVKSDPIKIRII